MRTVRLGSLLVGIVVVASCGSVDPAPAEPQAETPPAQVTSAPAPPPAGEVRDGIEAMQINGVWVFRHDPGGGMDALHSGTPEIVEGCLYVDDTIVVWHVDRMGDAAAAVAAANAGAKPPLLIGGGGLSLDEGGDAVQIPSVITERCPTRAVWFGSP